jgi:hypothetical protein
VQPSQVLIFTLAFALAQHPSATCTATTSSRLPPCPPGHPGQGLPLSQLDGRLLCGRTSGLAGPPTRKRLYLKIASSAHAFQTGLLGVGRSTGPTATSALCVPLDCVPVERWQSAGSDLGFHGRSMRTIMIEATQLTLASLISQIWETRYVALRRTAL